MDSPAEDRYTIPNLRNACRVLKLLGQANRGMKVADLARRLDLPSTTALRIVHTLTQEGLLRREDNLLFLGPVLIHLGARTSADTEIRELAQPLLQKLGHLTGETAHLALPCDDRSLIVSVYDSPHPLRAASSPGTLTDLYTSSTGKVFLAFLHADRIAAILALHPPPARTSRSLTTLAQLTAETERVHAQGYAIDDEEFHPGVRCVAAPVTGHGGQVVAALGITAAAARFTRERIPEMSAKVVGLARELSAVLGHDNSA